MFLGIEVIESPSRSTYAVLTVFLVHQNLERVHLIVLKSLSNLLAHVLVCQLSIHEAVGGISVSTQAIRTNKYINK